MECNQKPVSGRIWPMARVKRETRQELFSYPVDNFLQRWHFLFLSRMSNHNFLYTYSGHHVFMSLHMYCLSLFPINSYLQVCISVTHPHSFIILVDPSWLFIAKIRGPMSTTRSVPRLLHSDMFLHSLYCLLPFFPYAVQLVVSLLYIYSLQHSYPIIHIFLYHMWYPYPRVLLTHVTCPVESLLYNLFLCQSP